MSPTSARRRVLAFRTGRSLGRRSFGAAAAAVAATAGLAAPPVATGQAIDAPRNTVAPRVVGTPRVGESLHPEGGGWAGTAPLVFTFQWQRCGASGAGCLSISGATGYTYRTGPSDAGSRLRVRVTASNRAGSASALSSLTAAVASASQPTATPIAAPTNVRAPLVEGSATQGGTLHPANGAWTGTEPLTFRFQWRRCDPDGANCASIASATAYTYRPSKADAGSRLRVVVTAQNAAGTASATSAPTPVVPALTSPGSTWDGHAGPLDTPGACVGVRVDTSTDLNAAVAANPPGTTFCLLEGVHRMTAPVTPKAGDSFIGERGAVLSGAKLITSEFVRQGSFWVASGQTQRNPTVKGTCQPSSFTGCRYAEDVYFDDRLLARVMDLPSLRPGTFYFDYGASRIYIADDPVGHRVEAAVARGAFRGWQTAAFDVTVRNLVIEKFANEAQFGAVNCGLRWVVEDNEVRFNHAMGIQGGSIVRNNSIHHNGQLGLGSRGELVEGNEIAFNNTARFSAGWEAGGAKWVLTDGLVVRGNYVHDNDGPGLWTDIGNIRTRYEGNLIEDNSRAGIMHEISYDAVIRNNVVRGNGFGTTTGWLDGAGILIASSPNVEIYGNVVSDNWNGIGVTQTDRGAGRFGPYEAHDIFVHDNRVTMKVGRTGLAQGVGDYSYFETRNNRFAGNTYVVSCSNASPFAWRSPRGQAFDGRLSLAEWRSVGNDVDGSFLPCS